MSLNWSRVAEAVGLSVLVGASLFVVIDRKHLFEKRVHPLIQIAPPVAETRRLQREGVLPNPSPTGHWEKKSVPARPQVKPKAPVYRRVLPGGNRDGVMTCGRLKSLVSATPAQIEQFASAYHISPDAVRALKECYDH